VIILTLISRWLRSHAAAALSLSQLPIEPAVQTLEAILQPSQPHPLMKSHLILLARILQHCETDRATTISPEKKSRLFQWMRKPDWTPDDVLDGQLVTWLWATDSSGRLKALQQRMVRSSAGDLQPCTVACW
jgi:hypothetical protein